MLAGSKLSVFLPDGGTFYFGSAGNDDYFERTELGFDKWLPRLSVDKEGRKTKYEFYRPDTSSKSYLKKVSLMVGFMMTISIKLILVIQRMQTL